MTPDTREIVETMRTLHDHDEDETPEELRESAYHRGVEYRFQMVRDLLQGYEVPDPVVAPFERHARLIHYWRLRQGNYHTDERAKVQRPPWP